jgi:probable rRNA maturation factor
VERLIHALDESGKFAPPSGDLSVALLSTKAMAELHGRFLEDPTPTDVITFDGDPESNNAGEICVCPDIAAEYAADHELNFSEELALYIAHGYLHLCGFDDTTADQRKRMRAAERAAMGVAMTETAIPTFTLRPAANQRT